MQFLESVKKIKIYFYARIFVRDFCRLGFKIIRKINPNFRIRKAGGTGGTISARYCYSVYMRHLVQLFHNGMTKIPGRAAEFGPGDSIGIGLCALLAGAHEYYGLDIVDYANDARNVTIFNELVTLFKEKTNIPDNKEFPRVMPLLDDYSFPSYIIDDSALERNLSEERLKLIKHALSPQASVRDSADKIKIKYIVPWEKYPGNYPMVDFVFSQAVLEHIDNLEHFYSILPKILSGEGFTSHDIDFRSHGDTYEWNAHWAISEKKWEKTKGPRPYLINREPLSTHLQLLKKNGFQIVAKLPCSGEDGPSIKRKKLAEKFANLSNEDFETSTCFIIAKKAFSPS